MIPALLDNALGYNIYRVSLLMRRELTNALSEYGMTPEQWQIMATLWSTGKPLSQNEIVTITLKEKTTVSRIIKRLERDGWIEKEGFPKDTRVSLIRPTEKSLKLKDIVPRQLYSHFDALLDNFSEDEIQTLTRLLKKMRYRLEANSNPS